MIRILVVDDHPMVRAGLTALLGRIDGLEVVGEAGGVAAAIDAAARLRPDVVLMDVRLPDGSGVEACREIQSAGPRTRVLFLTSYPDEQATVSTVLGGAYGFLLKDIGEEELVRAIRDAAAGRIPVESGSMRAARLRLTQVSTLSPQECRVLELVVAGRTNREIGSSLALSEKTVRNYLSNAFQKLGVSRRSEAAVAFTRGRR